MLIDHRRDGHAMMLGMVTDAMRLAGAPESRRVAFLQVATSGDYGHMLRTVSTVLTDTFSTIDPAVAVTPEWDAVVDRIEKYFRIEKEKINEERKLLFDCTHGHA